MNGDFSLGTRLQILRKERELSQRDLAKSSGISVNAISLIERDQISPNVATLQRLAAALNVRMVCFFDSDQQVSVVHAKAGERASTIGRGLTLECMGARLAGQQMGLFLLTLSAGPDAGCEPVVHTGHEFVFCVRGKVQYEVDGSRYLLEPGDMLLFEASLSHDCHNRGAEEAQILLVLQDSGEPQEASRQHFRNQPALTRLG